MRGALALVISLLLWGCSQKEERNLSPNGQLYFVTSVERSKADPGAYRCVVLEIKSTNGTTLLRENSRASATQRWRAYWASDNEVVLDSSDIGPVRWRIGPNSTSVTTKVDENQIK